MYFNCAKLMFIDIIAERIKGREVEKAVEMRSEKICEGVWICRSLEGDYERDRKGKWEDDAEEMKRSVIGIRGIERNRKGIRGE